MKCYFVDAFAEKVFEGNPAAVCILEKWPSDNLMQLIAKENNLSETAFAVKTGDKYHLRWFTPGGEIDLCGHATLATAFVLANFYTKEAKQWIFQTLSGDLTVLKKGELFEMDFPSRMPAKIDISNNIINALGVTPVAAYLARDLMLVLEDENNVLQATPNFTALKEIEDGVGVILTAKSNQFDFVSRAFFPKLNVNEDPVCGSAHCQLIPYWSEKLNKTEMVARHLSERGGTLYCKLDGERVRISGYAVLYSVAELQLEADY
ncbi:MULTISPECIES: PhzF family phenazine biosynthesis protein [unclassified Niallia]|uniref:PhzF family phenazine biosynthesis protein n=1 Tax=unclassified Niallia TaxID=2837522 RepID=UPI001EDC8219|nr:PhzF family phenazine biosynthesis protein [Niallia sp. Man26]UPO90326.1 PhzF family phenazine biosynthesis protein [Niallia sp. Man26]